MMIRPEEFQREEEAHRYWTGWFCLSSFASICQYLTLQTKYLTDSSIVF